MKLLIAHRDVHSGPHAFTSEHLAQLQQCAPDWNIVAAGGAETIAHEAKDADAIAGFPATIPEIIVGMPVRWVHSFSAGVDRVLTPHVVESDIAVSNSSGIHATPIAEHVLCFLLMWVRRSATAYRNQQQHLWSKDERLGELRGKTVLVVGMGEIGTEVARLAHAFGCRTIGLVREQREKPDYVDELIPTDSLDGALSRADFVVICLPGGEQTRHFIDAPKFSLMKKSAAIVNIGRGTILNQDELIAALQDGTIAGALLDVTNPEPLPPESPLWSMENVLITPHHSGLSEKYMDRAIEQLCRNLKAFAAGTPLPNAVDKAAGY